MIGFVMIGTNNLGESSKFYDAILSPLGIIKVMSAERNIGYAKKNSPEKIELYVTKPHNKEPATNGNGTMIALKTDSRANVDKFHAIALENGGVNEGLPGSRHDNNYYAYIRDADGNKICAYTNSKIWILELN